MAFKVPWHHQDNHADCYSPLLSALQNEAQSEVAKGTRAGKVRSVLYDDSILGLAC
jgi:hypothetical protein